MIKNNIKTSSWALIGSNLFLVIGVMVFGYSLFSLMFIYWFENVVIGLFNVFKILLARGELNNLSKIKFNGKTLTGKESPVALAVFFLFHYGFFSFVHGIFVFVLFSGYNIDPAGVFLGMIAVAASHGVSFFVNYLGGGEYKRKSAAELFSAPYKRIFVLHIGIIGGGFVIHAMGAPSLFLVLFALLKLAFDLSAHQKEHGGKLQLTIN